MHFSTHLPLNWWIWRVNGCCNEWQILSGMFFPVAFNFAMNIHSLSELEVAALENVCFMQLPKQLKAKIGCSPWIISLKRALNLLWCSIFRTIHFVVKICDSQQVCNAQNKRMISIKAVSANSTIEYKNWLMKMEYVINSSSNHFT